MSQLNCAHFKVWSKKASLLIATVLVAHAHHALHLKFWCGFDCDHNSVEMWHDGHANTVYFGGVVKSVLAPDRTRIFF